MSTYRGHYLPVEARREVLRIYRDRRVNGTLYGNPRLTALDAMTATVDYFQGWLAHGVAFKPVGRQSLKELTDQYRAAKFYLDQMYAKPSEFMYRRRSDYWIHLKFERQQQIRRELEAAR